MVVNSCCKLLLTTGSSILTRSMKASIESFCNPVPLFLFAFWMVSHMFPGRLSSWIGGGCCEEVLYIGGSASGYSPCTICMLLLLMVAILLNVQARVSTVL